MISIRNLTVEFGGVRPISDLTVDLEGRVCGIVGPNGAGKTTLLNVISGYVRPKTGTLTFRGEEFPHRAPYRRARWGIRRTFQTEQVADDLTVFDNVLVGADNIGVHVGRRREAVMAALAITGLTAVAGRMGATLNAYQRRMTEISRALVGEPKIVMLDEPGAGLAHSEADRLRDVILSIPDRTGAFVCLIDHDIDLIAACCDRTAVLDFGELLAVGETKKVLADDRVRKAYVGG